MWIFSAISVFFFGVLAGFLLAAVIVFYILSKTSEVERDNKDDECTSKKELKEGGPTEEDKKLVSDALKFLKGEDVNVDDESFPSEEKAIGKEQMDKAFAEYSKDSKERQKQVRCLHSFFGEYNRLSKSYSKDLAKLSLTAESYVKAENDKYLDKWWNALSIAMDHLSQDQDYLSDVLEHDICYHLHRIYEEHSHLERQLNSEGSRHLNKMKEAMSAFELRSRDRDRLREKMNGVLERAANANALPATLTAETARWTQKLSGSESLLQDAVSRLAIAQQEFNEKMPRILADYKLMTGNSTSTMRELLIKLADIVTTTHTKSNQVMHRLKMDLASSTMLKQEELHLYDPSLKDVLENIAEGNPQRLDMKQESAAGLAASLPSRVPTMPTQFAKAIGKETCVWLNAFSGRMYRDTARSDYFHNWFHEKVAKMLNKDRRPGYIDEFSVSNVAFGSIPPLLNNMQWAPVCMGDGTDPEYDVACTADMAFRSGLQFTVSTRLWLNWPMDRFAFIPVVIKLEISELSGKIRFGVRKRRSFISFVDEPYSRFTVHSEVGSQYKVRNLPKLASMIIKKIKNHIRKKLIYPKSYEFRLVWPKNWWPGGPDGDLSSGPSEKVPFTDKEKIPPSPLSPEAAGASTGSVLETPTKLADHLVTTDPPIQSPGGTFELTSTANASGIDDSEKDFMNSPNTGISSKSMRETLGRWFQRPLGPKVNTSERVEFTGLDGVEDKWRQAFDTTLKNVNALQDQGELIPEYEDISGLRSCVSTTELIRKQTDYPHVRDIFAPLHNANTTPELQICANFARSRPRGHSISDFRSSTLSHMVLHVFTDRSNNKTRSDMNSSYSNAVVNIRAYDDTDLEMRSRLNWLRRPLQNNGIRLKSQLENLKSKIAVRMAKSESPSSRSRSGPVAVAGAMLGALADGRSVNPAALNRSASEPTEVPQLDSSGHDEGDSERLNIAIRPESVPTVGKAKSGFLNFGKKFLEAKETLKNEITKTVERRKKSRSIISNTMSCVSYQPEDNELDESGASGDEEMFGRHNDDRRRSHTRSLSSDGRSGSIGSVKGISIGSTSSSSSQIIKSVSKGSKAKASKQDDPEQEAMTLAWQARAEAITLAAEDGQQPSMQGFLRTPLRKSPKMWVVLRSGSLAVFTDPADCQGGTPKTVYSLSESVCRPLDQPNSFELGVSDDKGRGRIWLAFWAESDVQCKAWVMAVQHSANLPHIQN
mmetsp:Transcript_22551/g.22741  ORF Transcript_22551/g.22741 Transcript_22551/m.22741 type:complete len:1219 (+) Transcript_22551:249-3905(+)|eukprot:CAMPEP_0182436398 /NCGR_PEP_ID=MMETSP1167-20130531/81301_1 /TAXON_ID=2988 /ORGANISM="Mallomonas Sp, Strain CCMP3275" /LENGTH=1218 /DNA_ID=CAMNT_0024628533 /DNA_START=199 /DNA_END=3855 /DNA_ORIENTATION=+